MSCIMRSALSGIIILAISSCGPRVETVVLYEGLPHQLFEFEKMKEEMTSKPVTKMHRYPFYEQPLPISREDATTLLNVVKDSNFYRPFQGEKKCGGFHPDYAVEWKEGSRTYLVMICYGCGELKRFGPDGEERFEMGEPAKALHAVLNGRRQNRPAKEDQ